MESEEKTIKRLKITRRSSIITSTFSFVLMNSMVGMVYFGNIKNMATAALSGALCSVGACCMGYNLYDLFQAQKRLNTIKKEKSKIYQKK